MRVCEVSARTRIVGLIGWPIEHSLSPAIHNYAFEQAGLDWCYVPLPVAPSRLGAAVKGLVALGMAGVNVTTPHKQAVIPHLADLDPQARAIGAANTLVVQKGRLTGYNTDGTGFLSSLAELEFDPTGSTCVVLGAGGAARAVVSALARAGATIHVYNRTLEHAMSLTSSRVEVHRLAELPNVPPSTCLLVNATTLGFGPQRDLSPWPASCPIPSNWLVYDLVYNPEPSPLLMAARQAGAATLDGLPLLVHQAAQSFALWTGEALPVEIFWQAARGEIQRREGC
jgi:shikimate dehydrogenase